MPSKEAKSVALSKVWRSNKLLVLTTKFRLKPPLVNFMPPMSMIDRPTRALYFVSWRIQRSVLPSMSYLYLA